MLVLHGAAGLISNACLPLELGQPQFPWDSLILMHQSFVWDTLNILLIFYDCYR